MLRGIKTGAQEQNKLEIDLALRTLEFLGRLARAKKIESGADTRTLAACLCEWQEGATTIVPKDGIVHEGKAYCFAGGPTWQAWVKEGKLSGADAVAPAVTAFCWLQKLFQLFTAVKFDEDEAAVARRLAACWYYTATECNFDESEEAPEGDKIEPIAPQQLLGMLFARQTPAGAPDMGDSDEDDEEGDESLDDEEGEEGEDDDEEDDDEEEDAVAGKPAAVSLTNELMKDADDELQEDDGEFEPEDDEDEDDEDDEPVSQIFEFFVEEETAAAKEIRTTVLKGVETLNAFLPLPSTDMLFFKRMLLRMQAGDEITQKWFPWGVPPWEPLKAAVKSSDPLLQNYATEILRLFAQQAAGK